MRAMLSPGSTRRAAGWVCCATTAASLLACLLGIVLIDTAPKHRGFDSSSDPSRRDSGRRESGAGNSGCRDSEPADVGPTSLTEIGLAHRAPAHEQSQPIARRSPSSSTWPSATPSQKHPLLFVAGPTKDVRFRIDLQAGTVATRRAGRILERVVDVALAERFVLLCQAALTPRRAPHIVRFDLRTGKPAEVALAAARAASVDPAFCAGRQSLTARPAHPWGWGFMRYSTALQMSLERQATILPRVSNGEEQSSFLISSRHSLSSLVTTPPGQS